MRDSDVSLYLALDQGSHASKALVYDEAGRRLAGAERPLATTRPRPDMVEHDPEEVVDSLRAAIADAVAALPPGAGRLRAAGLAIQRSSVVCWDRETGAALSPVLSWQDRRHAAWLAGLGLDAAWLRETTGLVASPHYGASKLRWCLDELPPVRRALEARRLALGPLASFVLYRLLEERPLRVDPANAARTLLWKLASGDWDTGLLEIFKVPRWALPRCGPSRQDFGTLPTPAGPVPFKVMTGDQPAALFARGEPRAGELFVNIGTGAFVQQVFAGRCPRAGRLLESVAWDDGTRRLGVLEGTVNGAGAALQWLAETHGLEARALAEEAEAWLAEARNPPLFFNGVGGLGSPFWVPDFEPRFSAAADLAGETVAVLESIVFLVQVNLEALAAATDAPPGRIIVSGGLASLDGLCQRLASLSGLELVRPGETEATGRGLAWLLGAGRDGGAPPQDEQRFAPRPDAALESRYERWREGLPALPID